MPNPLLVLAGVSAGGSAISAGIQADAARHASDAQVVAAEEGIAEQRRQFDSVQKLLAPFVTGGTDASAAMQALVGLSGDTAQADWISRIENSPLYQGQVQAGEDALLQQASATGGLRGGNTAAALAKFRPGMLSAEIDKTYGRLGDIASMGQASAAMQAAQAQALGRDIAAQYGQIGASQAGAAMARGQAWGNALGGIGQSFGNLMSYAPQMPAGASIFGKWGF